MGRHLFNLFREMGGKMSRSESDRKFFFVTCFCLMDFFLLKNDTKMFSNAFE